MSKFPKSASGFLLIFLALGPSGAFADDRTDSLHEGYQIEAGVRANRFKDGTIKPEGMIALTGDFALVPIPGGGRLNGTHLELE